MILESARIKLEPVQDFDYFLDLADKDNKFAYAREETRAFIDQSGKEFWTIFHNGKRIGVIGFFNVKGYYILEALKDRESDPIGISVSIECANLVMDYMFQFTDRIRTCARVDDKAIQILCRKLGFKEYARKESLILYEKER